MGNSSLSLLERVVLTTVLCVASVAWLALPARAEVFGCYHGWEREVTSIAAESWIEEFGVKVTEDQQIPSPELCIVGDRSSPDIAFSDEDGWAPLVSVYFSHEAVDRVLCLMDLESAGDPHALNPVSGAAGLMQVMPFWAGHFGYDVDELFEPAINLQVASYILEEQGWNAWSPFVRGSCR